MEIPINSVILTKDGFIIVSNSVLSGQNYYLNINDGVNQTTKTYTPTVSGTIIDAWSSPVPIDGANVCFVLNDILCPALGATLIFLNEVPITAVNLTSEGYVIKTGIVMTPGAYELVYNDGINQIKKPYLLSKSGDIIIDMWTNPPADGSDVCFSLYKQG